MTKRRNVSRCSSVNGCGLISDLTSGVTSAVGNVVGLVGDVAGTVVNKAVDLLPVELHLPGGYRYCGPGTKLKKRLARGDRGINKLDEACKEHDISYSKYKDNEHRVRADRELADRAWARVKSSDASLGEKAAAWAVTNAMKVKAKLGGGVRRGKKRCDCKKKKVTQGKGYYLRPYKGTGIRKKKRATRGKKKSSR